MKNSKQSLHVNNELCVDVKMYTIKNGRMQPGDIISATVLRPNEDQFTIIENVKSMPRKRMPVTHLYRGKAFNMLSNSKGQRKLTLKYQPFMTAEQFREYIAQLSVELQALSGFDAEEIGLVEEAEAND